MLTVVSIGAMMAAFGRVTRVNRELRETREELATLAVAEERLRIARDVHDLLGHSLSVITLKSELAARLLERDPARAAGELEEIQAVSREALAEVREAVKGYRGLALAESLTRARTALTAAGIDCELAGAQPALPADVDAVLAWAVREGTTNVIRHSQARHCEIRIRADGESAALEIDDDGRAAPAPSHGGSGLEGLRERAQRVRGTLEAGARPGGRLPAARHRPAGRAMIRVLIAEDQAMVRGALASLLALEDDIEVVERGLARRRGARRGARERARRRAARHRDARPRRHRGGGRARARAAGAADADPHHLRPPRLPAPRARERRPRLPPQGRPRARAGGRDPHRRRPAAARSTRRSPPRRSPRARAR